MYDYIAEDLWVLPDKIVSVHCCAKVEGYIDKWHIYFSTQTFACITDSRRWWKTMSLVHLLVEDMLQLSSSRIIWLLSFLQEAANQKMLERKIDLNVS